VRFAGLDANRWRGGERRRDPQVEGSGSQRDRAARVEAAQAVEDIVARTLG